MLKYETSFTIILTRLHKSIISEESVTVKKSTAHISTTNDERQGLVFSFDYRSEMSRYCTILRSRSHNISTNTPQGLAHSNAATLNIIKGLGENGQYETTSPLVSNCDDTLLPSKQAYPKWRNTNHTIKSIYIQKALTKRAKERGLNQYAITMKFTPTLAEKIMAKGAGHIQEALTRQLKRALGYAPDMWTHLEASASNKADKHDTYNIHTKSAVSHSYGVLHMHGAITLSQNDLAKAKDVVRRINKSTNSIFKNHEIRLDEIHNELGWVGYCHKHHIVNSILLGDVERYSRTRDLGRIAQELYEEDRRKHKINHRNNYV